MVKPADLNADLNLPSDSLIEESQSPITENVGIPGEIETSISDSVASEPDAKLEYNHGIDCYKLGQYEEAISSFRSAIRLYPDYIDAYYNLGSLLDYLNQSDEALAIYEQIISRNNKEYEAFYQKILA